mmetsp:Transcript_20559/g.54828  ORF Transcript_20559/g.54828 Transcript_20559/m.54828 type:complete len:307 (-) Transcript_20559:1606-2526(-)
MLHRVVVFRRAGCESREVAAIAVTSRALPQLRRTRGILLGGPLIGLGAERLVGEADAKRGAFAQLALNREAAAMLHRNLSGDGQPQTQAFVAPPLRLVLLAERLEDQLLVFRGDSDAAVLHGDRQDLLLVVRRRGHSDIALACEFQCVRDEIVQHLHAPVRVRLDDRQALADIAAEIYLGSPQRLAGFVDRAHRQEQRLLDHFGDVHGIPRQPCPLALHQGREVHDVSNQVEQPPRTIEHELDGPMYFAELTLREDVLAQPNDAMEWRAQLVRDCGCKLRLLQLQLPQAGDVLAYANYTDNGVVRT